MEKHKFQFDAEKMESLKDSIGESKSSAVKAISQKLIDNHVGGETYGKIGYIQTLFGQIVPPEQTV